VRQRQHKLLEGVTRLLSKDEKMRHDAAKVVHEGSTIRTLRELGKMRWNEFEQRRPRRTGCHRRQVQAAPGSQHDAARPAGLIGLVFAFAVTIKAIRVLASGAREAELRHSTSGGEKAMVGAKIRQVVFSLLPLPWLHHLVGALGAMLEASRALGPNLVTFLLLFCSVSESTIPRAPPSRCCFCHRLDAPVGRERATEYDWVAIGLPGRVRTFSLLYGQVRTRISETGSLQSSRGKKTYQYVQPV